MTTIHRAQRTSDTGHVETTKIPGQRARGRGHLLFLGQHPSEVGRGRRHVAEACRDYGGDVIDTAMLLASELITNAMQLNSGEITLLVTHSSRGVRVDVSDASPCSPTPRDAGAGHENGRGLLIVERMATEWGVEQAPQCSGKSVWFRLCA